MKRTPYIIDHNNKTQDDFVEIFKNLLPFVNNVDMGKKDLTRDNASPYHLIRKESWELYARHQNGEMNLIYQGDHRLNGKPFELWHVWSKTYRLTPNMVKKHIDPEKDELYYSTGGRRGYTSAYVDVDAHEEDQDDQLECREKLEQYLGGYWAHSGRGENGWLLIDYHKPITSENPRGGRYSWEDVNDQLKVLESLLKRLLKQNNLKCDVEVKNTITTRYTSGTLAKLPFSPGSYDGDLEDEIKKFEDTKIISLKTLKVFCQRLKEELDQAEPSEEECKEILGQTAGSTSASATLPSSDTTSEPSAWDDRDHTLGKYTRPAITDAYKRHLDHARQFCRWFFRSTSTLPTSDHLSAFENYVFTHRLFTGFWGDNKQQRRVNLRNALAYTLNGFDASKVSTSENCEYWREVDEAARKINCREFVSYCRTNFPKGLDRYESQITDGEDGLPIKVWKKLDIGHVTDQQLAVWLAVFKYFCVTSPFPDRSVPVERVRDVFLRLKELGQHDVSYDDKHIPTVRNWLTKNGHLAYSDYSRRQKQARVWTVLTNVFERLSQWYKREKVASRFDAEELVEEKTNKRTIQSNHVRDQESWLLGNMGNWPLERPPP